MVVLPVSARGGLTTISLKASCECQGLREGADYCRGSYHSKEGASPCVVAVKPRNPAGENAVFQSEWNYLQGAVWETLLPCLGLFVEGAQPCSKCCIKRPVEQSTFAAHFGQCRAVFRMCPALFPVLQ